MSIDSGAPRNGVVVGRRVSLGEVSDGAKLGSLGRLAIDGPRPRPVHLAVCFRAIRGARTRRLSRRFVPKPGRHCST